MFIDAVVEEAINVLEGNENELFDGVDATLVLVWSLVPSLGIGVTMTMTGVGATGGTGDTKQHTIVN